MRRPGAGNREMRELPPAKDEEQYVDTTHVIKRVRISPQGFELPRSGVLGKIRGRSRATSVDGQIMVVARGQRRLARWLASSPARPITGSIRGETELDAIKRQTGGYRASGNRSSI